MSAIGGIIPALVTPTDDRGAPDLGRLPGVLDHVLQAGVHGVFAMGGQGEFWAFTPEEQAAVAQVVVAHVDGRVPVLIGISAETTRQCHALAARAADSGADMVTLMPPMAGPLTQPELEAHVTALADASALPVVLYHHPARARTAFSLPLVQRLTAHPGVVGIKDSSGSLATLLQLQRLASSSFSVMVGNDAMISSALLAGCAGAVAATGNVVPALLVAMHDACAAGDVDRATQLQQRLLPLRTAFALGTFPVVVKEAMAMIGLPVGPAAAPVAPLTDDARQQLRTAVDEAVA